MKRRICVVLVVLLALVQMVCVPRVQAESDGVFQPMLDTDTSCTITVIGSYSKHGKHGRNNLPVNIIVFRNKDIKSV